MELARTLDILEKYAELVSSEYIQELRVRGYRLANSVEMYVDVIDNKYQVVLSLDDYWVYIEEGRKPGRFPPTDKIIKWIREKGITPRQRGLSERSLAFLIGRKISRQGIKPKKILDKIDKKYINILEEITEAFSKDVLEYIEIDIKKITN